MDARASAPVALGGATDAPTDAAFVARRAAVLADVWGRVDVLVLAGLLGYLLCVGLGQKWTPWGRCFLLLRALPMPPCPLPICRSGSGRMRFGPHREQLGRPRSRWFEPAGSQYFVVVAASIDINLSQKLNLL